MILLGFINDLNVILFLSQQTGESPLLILLLRLACYLETVEIDKYFTCTDNQIFPSNIIIFRYFVSGQADDTYLSLRTGVLLVYLPS